MTLPQLPDDLQERLRRAGVTDQESFQRALENDPQLAADLQAFLESNPEMLVAAMLPDFLDVQNPEQMRAFWRRVPTELEQPFIELVERLIAEAPPETPAAALESLRARLRDFRELCEAARAARNIPPELREVLEELARRGVEIRSAEDLQRALDAHPDLRQKLEAAQRKLQEQLPPELREVLAELARRGVKIRSEEDLRRTLEENPDLRARLERAAQNMQGGLPIPPEFHQDLQQATEGVARYTQTGDLNALNAAIAAWERILNHPAFARADERFRLAAWNDAGGAYLRRYWRLGDTTDLDKALNLWQQAVAATPEGHPHLPSRLNNLGNGLSDRYRRTGRLEDLEEAIRVLRQAVAATPEGHPDLPSILNNLGTGLSDRYRRTGRLEDLEEAIRVLRQAVAATPEGHPDLPGYLNNLGTGLSDRYRRTGEMRDLEEAIRVYRQAVAATPEGHPDLPSRLNNLGNELSDRYSRTGEMRDLEEAIRVYRQAVENVERNPADTLRAARNGLRLAFEAGRWEDVLGFWEAVQAAGQARLRAQFEREDKIATLGETRGLSALAAWAAGQQGDLPRAAEILESGRAQLLREAQERQRRDLHALAGGEYDALYRAYRAAARQVDDLYALSYAQRPADWGQQLAAAQGALQQATEALRDQAPGFKYFLRPLPFDAIQQQADDAPLVYLAATERGGFALVVPPQTAEAWHIPLPQLTDKSLRERVQGPDDDPAWGGYLGAYLRWRNDPRDETARAAWFTALEETLDWLGKAVMHPLVTALQENGLPQGALVRLVPGGLLGLLPLHAGRWTVDGGRETVDGEAPSTVHGQPSTFALDHYTFTYAPSAQALYHASAAVEHQRSETLMAVNNPDGSLVYTEWEVKEILAHRWQGRPKHLRHKQATRKAVLEAMPQHDVLHFSTHGQAGWSDAEEARLTLTDGDLALGEIFDLRLTQPRLAVLSACETGVPALENLDEVESLPSGLMQAGISGVVGSLWSVNDASTAILMALFYHFWREEALLPPFALNKAQRWLRDAAHDAEIQAQLETWAERGGLRMTAETAEKSLTQVLVRDFKDPFYWAAFTYTGL